MGVFDKIKNVFGVDDDDYEDDFEYYEDEEDVAENIVKREDIFVTIKMWTFDF